MEYERLEEQDREKKDQERERFIDIEWKGRRENEREDERDISPVDVVEVCAAVTML